jgi:hypothetical protein
VREAVIQVILHVARNFPVIRFDAAMTLAKKHVNVCGSLNPAQAARFHPALQYGMTKAEFDDKDPRRVLARGRGPCRYRSARYTFARRSLLAAWKGYFVRTLGMHRVYNSAFMHMLRDEDNAKYRMAIKNTLEFDPQILKRYVNFMNNPDEKTAVEQFGKGDKYFGICHRALHFARLAHVRSRTSGRLL